MKPFRISVIHATARIAPPYPSFPTGWRESCRAFGERADHPEEIEYVLSVHESNWEEFCKREEQQPWPSIRFGNFKVVKNTGRNCVVDQGAAACEASTGEILVGGMDDLFPPEHWDTLIQQMFLLNNTRTHHPPVDVSGTPLVLHVRTGSPLDDIIFIPQIMTRARWKQMGYFLHPSYDGMFSDNEFTEVAKRDGVVLDARHIVFEHRHPLFGTAQMDPVYQGENREQAYADGLTNFEYRKSLGFPRFSEPQHAPKKVSIALCLPGETFNQEWVAGAFDVFDELVNSLNMKVHVQLAFTSNVYCTRMQITDAVMPEKPDLWLWIDDDNRLSKEKLRFLLQDLAEHQELDAVVGWCWCDSGRDNLNWQMSVGRQDENMGMLKFTAADVDATRENPILPIEWSGFPCVLIRGAAMEQLGSKAFVPIVKEGLQFGFTSEDASFWWNFRQAGFKVAVDLRCEVPHMKYRIIRPVFLPQSAVKESAREMESAMP